MAIKATGFITIADITDIINKAAAPSNPIVDMLWYDTVNNQLKKWNGNAWIVSNAKEIDAIKTITESNSTAITVQQGKINTLISNTTITKDGVTTQLKDEYAATVVTVNSINATVGEHTTTINNLGQTITESANAAIALNNEGIFTKVSANYISKEDQQTIIDSASSTAISQTKQAITLEFTDYKKLINAVDANLQTEIESRKSYIRFENGAIKLGVVGSEFNASLDNDSLDFIQGIEIVAQITNKKMLITDAEIKNRLTLGQTSRGYFDFVPRDNGNLSLKWRAS